MICPITSVVQQREMCLQPQWQLFRELARSGTKFFGSADLAVVESGLAQLEFAQGEAGGSRGWQRRRLSCERGGYMVTALLLG